MKNVKKLLSILVVLTLVLSLGASAFAADITISDANGSGSTYQAYKLLNLTTTADANASNDEPNDKTEKGFAYTVNEKYLSILETAAGIKDAPDPEYGSTIVKYISELDADGLRVFADEVFAAIEADPEIGPDEEAEGTTFSGVDQGYYLIVENLAEEGDPDNTVRSLVMLDTAGQQNLTVKTKEERPSSEKKVQEKNDSAAIVEGINPTGWQDGADYDIGDQVPFQLKATIPAGTTTHYTTYKLTFHDKESTGLTFNASSVVVTVNGETLDKNTGYAVVTEGLEDGCTFEIVFTNIKTLKGFTADDDVADVITVDYTSELNTSAEIGEKGNPNEMHIEYSNNPYDDEDTGHTPDDKVIVFTFKLKADKVRPGNEEGTYVELEGAGFTLLKKVPSVEPAPDTVTWEELGKTVAGELVTYNEGTYQVVHAEMTGVIEFTFEGLDSGDYLLVETTVPEGYNRANDIEIAVTATYETKSGDPKLLTLSVPDDIGFTATPADGLIKGNVVNRTGLELPETGGIGTTIFYVVGAILVAGAVILLVTRKRMSGAEK